MARPKIIQVTATSREPIRKITEDVRLAVSRACSGVDDMHLLGAKALVVRAEILPEKLSVLASALEKLGLTVDRDSVPNSVTTDRDALYPITVQVTSHSGDTNGRVIIPDVPG